MVGDSRGNEWGFDQSFGKTAVVLPTSSSHRVVLLGSIGDFLDQKLKYPLFPKAGVGVGGLVGERSYKCRA